MTIVKTSEIIEWVKNAGRSDLKNELPKGNTSITNKVLKNKRIR